LILNNNEQIHFHIKYPKNSWHKFNELKQVNLNYNSSCSASVTGAVGLSLCCTQTAGTTKSIAYSQRFGSVAESNAGSKPQFKRTYFWHLITTHIYF